MELEEVIKSGMKKARDRVLPLATAAVIACGGGGGNGGGCVSCPPPNSDPNVSLNVQETQGEMPFTAQGESTCEDPDGDNVNLRMSFGDGSPEETASGAGNTSLNFSHTYEEIGSYTLEARCTDGNGGSDTETRNIDVEKPPQQTQLNSGTLKSNESKEGRSGKLEFYALPDTSFTDSLRTDASGNWSERTLAGKADSYLVQARIEENGEKGLVRTVRVDASDDEIDLAEIFAIPPDGLAENGITPEDFSKHVCYPNENLDPINRGIQYDRGLEDCINTKSSVDSFYVFKSATENGKNLGEFTEEEQSIIEDQILGPISRWRESGTYHVVVGPVDSPPYTRNEDGIITPNQGWSLVLRDSTISRSTTDMFGFSQDQILDGARINMERTLEKDGEETLRLVLTHEAGHAFGWPSHGQRALADNSIMASIKPGIDPPTDLDIKAKKMTDFYTPGENPRNYARHQFFLEENN